MAKFSVWDPINESENSALELEADDAQSAAVSYAEQDVDGDIDGLYTNEGEPLSDVAKDGHPIHVRDGNGVVTRWRVGVAGLEPLFAAAPVQFEETDRCEHGMYFTGAGACPMCGRGAE